MADTKISGLPASTTPLAGTEVLPIVQSGTTKQVSVANLTDGRAITAASAIISDNSVNAALRITQLGAGNALLVEDSANPDATPFVIDASGNVGIGTTTPNAQFEIVNAAAASAVTRSTAAGNAAYFLAAASDYFSTPSYRASYLVQYNASAGGTSLGLTNANLGAVAFQNGSSGAIFTNGATALRLGTNGATAINIASNQVISLGAIAGAESLRVTPVASAVNYVNVSGAITTGAPELSAQGSDTNINLLLRGKGTGVVALGGSTVANSGFSVNPVASSVNYVQAQGGITGNPATVSSQGTDSNVALWLQAQGNARTFFVNSGAFQASINPVASAVNYLLLAGGTTGNGAELSSVGSDANINLKLTPKGTGVVQYGTYTAGIIAQAGYITIADAGGTSRRLLVG